VTQLLTEKDISDMMSLNIHDYDPARCFDFLPGNKAVPPEHGVSQLPAETAAVEIKDTDADSESDTDGVDNVQSAQRTSCSDEADDDDVVINTDSEDRAGVESELLTAVNSVSFADCTMVEMKSAAAVSSTGMAVRTACWSSCSSPMATSDSDDSVTLTASTASRSTASVQH